MRLRNTFLALLVLAGLSAFIYYYEYLGEEKRETAADAEKNLVTFERDKVSAIEISREGQAPLELKKEADAWTLAAPLLAAPTRADQDKVDQILSSLSFLRVERTLTGVADSELEGYRLKEPAARVTLKVGEGKPDLSVSLGDKTPVGGYYYAMRPGSTDVLLVSGGVDSVVTADVPALRYKKVVGVDVWKVARFSIEKGDNVVTLRHGAPGTQEEDWRLERPVSFPADPTKVQGLWFDLQSAEAESFESEQPAAADLDRFGLTRPLCTLTVEPKESGSPVTVMFAGQGPAGPFYARRSDMGAVMKVKQDLVEKIEKAIADVDALRDARVAPVDRWKLAGIEIQRAGATVNLVKDDASKWRWSDKEGAEMLSEEVNSLIDAIEGTKATGYLDTAGPAPAGDPALTLTLKESGENARVVTVRVGAQGAAGGGRRVTSSVTTTAYIVPPAAIQTLIDRASALKAPQGNAAAPAGAATGETR